MQQILIHLMVSTSQRWCMRNRQVEKQKKGIIYNHSHIETLILQDVDIFMISNWQREALFAVEL